jgi:hypothetical protein
MELNAKICNLVDFSSAAARWNFAARMSDQ